jgi:hypothetical protein
MTANGVRAAGTMLVWVIVLSLMLAGCTNHEVSPSSSPPVQTSAPAITSAPASSASATPSKAPPPTVNTSPAPSTSVQFPPGTDLKYEIISSREISGISDLLAHNPLYVIISSPYLPVDGITDKEQAAIKSVDFNQNFVLIVTYPDSYPSGYPPKKSEIKRVWLDANTVYILAVLPPIPQPGMTYLPISSFSCHILKINKDGISAFDRITFKLLDDSARERATTTSLVPK